MLVHNKGGIILQLRVLTHSGEDAIVEVEKYNAKELAEKLNSHELNVIDIGDVVFSKIDIKLVKPIAEETKEK